MTQFIKNHILIVVFSVIVIIGTFVALTKPQGFLFAAAPSVPSNFSATPGDGQVTLTWTAPKGDTPEGYYIRHNNPNTTLDVKSTSTSYVVTGLTNGVTYTFYVAAYNREGTSSYSAPVTATPAVPVTVPDAPVLNSVTGGDGEVTLTWAAPVSDGGDPVNAYRITATPSGGTVRYINAGTGTSFTVTSLVNGTSYEFTVSARNGIGYSAESNSLSVTPGTGVSTPGAPALGALTAGNGQVQVSWSAPSDNGGAEITGYTVSYTPQDGSETTVDVGNNTSYTITGLTNGTRYSIKVAAVNSEGIGTYSSPNSTTPFTTPGAPAGLAITPGDGTLSLSWEAPNSNGSNIIGYRISYTPSGGSEQIVSGNGTSTTYTIEGLVNGVTYSVKVLARNSAGASSFSSAVESAPDQNVAPAIVGIPTVTVSNTSAVVAWQTNKYMSTRVDFGLLDVSARSTTELNTGVKVLSHTVTVSNLLACTTYSYRVYSKDSLNQTAVSSTQSFTTTGCEGEAEVKAIERDSVEVASGGELDFRNTVDAKLTVPANVKVGESDLIFQVKKLEKEDVQSAINVPNTSKRWLGDHAYKLSAYISEDEEVEDFDESVTITIEYTQDDIQGINQNTLSIYHYHDEEEGWHILENCTNTYNTQTGTGVISCTTPNFSVFGLFGEPEPESSSTGVYVPPSKVSELLSGESDKNQAMEDSMSEEVEIVNNVATENSVQFLKNLWRGLNNSVDVLNLQKFLNSQGFILAEDGPGSPGRETSYFGPKTQEALEKFQEKYSEQILLPLGLTSPTGYFGIMTRTFINENF